MEAILRKCQHEDFEYLSKVLESFYHSQTTQREKNF
jgi:hypothetical protein